MALIALLVLLIALVAVQIRFGVRAPAPITLAAAAVDGIAAAATAATVGDTDLGRLIVAALLLASLGLATAALVRSSRRGARTEQALAGHAPPR